VIALFPLGSSESVERASEEATNAIEFLLGREFVDLEPYVLPKPLAPNRLGLPSSTVKRAGGSSSPIESTT
jgi:hypothetical protein